MSETDAAEEALSVVLCTAPGDAAEGLVRRLVEERLIACGTLLPGLTSIYRWQAEVVTESETLMLLKTPRSRVARLFERLSALHPYEVPELMALPVEAVSNAYCRWVRRETTEVNA